MSDLVPLRLRVGYVPRDPIPVAQRAPGRRVELVHLHVGEDGGLLRAARTEIVDGQLAEVMLTAPADAGAAAWAGHQQLCGGAGTTVVPALVTPGQWGAALLRRGWQKRHPTVVFDSPDLGALAIDVRQPRQGDLSVDLVGGGAPSKKRPGQHADNFWRPRWVFDGPFVNWAPVPKDFWPKRRRLFDGPIVSLSRWGEALGADASSAAALCRCYGVPWPSDTLDGLDRLLAESLALAEVYRRMVAELADVAPGMVPESCWSAGSLITLALRRAGVREAGDTCADLPRWAIGACASAFYGGRVEALLVRVGLCLAMADLNSTYPALVSLLALTRHLAADHFEARRVPVKTLRRHFSGDLRRRLDDRGWWAAVGATFVLVEPHGEVLPCVRKAGDGWRTVSAPLDFGGGRLWSHAADLVRPALAGQFPKVVAAFRVVPVGTAKDLRPVRLPSGATCDLRTQDFGQVLVRERQLARGTEDSLVRSRRETLAKGVTVAGAWGIYGRVDAHEPGSQGIGPSGELLGAAGERPGPLTLWHVASAVTAGCRAIIGVAEHDIEAAGGSVAAVLTDCLVVPAAEHAQLVACPGGPHRLPDGNEAVRLLSLADLRRILARFDPVLHPDGGPAWKGEVGSLDHETFGLVAGLNKVLLGREEDGRLRLLRSSDTSLGDHFLDPTGRGENLPDGRVAWSAELEEHLLASLYHAGPGAPLGAPKNLPGLADRPALRPGRARTFGDLMWLREQVGDLTVPPFARYTQAQPGPWGGGPVCLGTGRDPATWRDWPWRKDGKPTGIFVLGDEGARVSGYQVATIRDVLEGWLRENDITTAGSERGLRCVSPVRSHPCLVKLAGKSGEPYSGVDDAPAYGGFAGSFEELLDQAGELGNGELRRRGVAARTADRATTRKAKPKAKTIATLAAAVAERQPVRLCTGCGKTLPTGSRAGRQWCSEACRKATARARKVEPGPPAPSLVPKPPAAPPDLDKALDLLAALPGMPEGVRPVLASSKRLGQLLAQALTTVTSEALAERVEAEGPLRGESPVGILVARLEALVPAMVADEKAKREAALRGHRRFGHRVGKMQAVGELPEATALAELRRVPVGELREAAVHGYLVATGLKAPEEVPV